MTDIDIDKLTPSPKTDVLVARALGWTNLTQSGRGWQGVQPQAPASSVARYWIPPYSTDWGAAMEAAEACDLFHQRELGQLVTSDDGNREWAVSEYSDERRGFYCLALAPTGPLAICKAILLQHQKGLACKASSTT